MVEKKNMEYEICYLIGESKEANLDKIRPIVEGIITKHKGTFLEGEFVRKRRLSYEIKREARGTYVARRFTIPSKDEREELFPDYDIMGEINKELRFNQDILRFMVVKTDDLPPLKDLEGIEEKSKEQYASRTHGREGQKIEKSREAIVLDKNRKFKAPKVEEVKAVEIKATETKDIKPAKKDVKEVKEVKAEEIIEEKPKKKSVKKEEGILGDDIDEKLDEILNI
ncbi:MAG: Translation initiation factor IF-2 [Candidatus Moranbacteria bacterium GW2011_GWE1_35_17]|nr:MAG: Translation initiation factor IF-2 [Candidatus Moranbacteria bacterium GW2011_GWE1_35_17]KKP84055.1 MAG: Translation initiation factor IF-2 [Candidatus Moranbacteria bacterium GW2011_GWF2_35_54]KKP84415.1 MAG: Translation initiation factor IF-2 [Candidatus Moranbacteria bacterium GW2011_GWF1_35_5]